MKHFIKKHRHHFGLWLFSAIVLVASTFWLKSVDKQLAGLDESAAGLAGQMFDQSSIAAAPANLSLTNSPSPTALTNQNKTKEKMSGVETKPPIIQPTENSLPAASSSAPDKFFLPENKIAVSFKIIASDWTREFQIAVPPGTSVYEAMKQLQSEQSLSFETKDFTALGAFVQSINGLANNPRDNLFWIYYVNDKPAQLGISSLKLNSNDVITWRYEEGRF